MKPRRRTLSPGFSRLLRVVGAVLLATGVAVIWATRLSSPTDVYLSEMGAPDAPTAALFNSALLAVACGGILVALARRGIRSSIGLLGAWSVTATLVFSCASIAVASRVTCTPGCPVPFTPSSTPTDAVHTLFAIFGFAGVGLAIIQSASAPGARALRIGSAWSGALIIVLSGVGGLLSVFRFRTDLGGWLELAAATIALLWVIVFALVPLAPPVLLGLRVYEAPAREARLSGSSVPTPAAAPPARS